MSEPKDDDEIMFRLFVSKDLKTYTLTIESPSAMKNSDFIMSLEAYLSDIIRAEKQLSDPLIVVH